MDGAKLFEYLNEIDVLTGKIRRMYTESPKAACITPPAEPKEPLWKREFYESYAVPAEIESLVAAGTLSDISWHNDVCPSFCLEEDDENSDEKVLKLWVENPDVNKREMTGKTRFAVTEECETI